MKRFEKIADDYRRLYRFLTHDIWVLDFTELGKAKRRLMRYLKASIITIKGISTDKIGMQATSLSFFSALSLAPAIALLFAVTGGFGMHQWLEDFVYSRFSGSVANIDLILKPVYNIIDMSSRGIYGFVTVIVLLWTLIMLMQNIEKCFNTIWKVQKGRSSLKRFAYYIGILLISPFIIFAFLWVSVMFTTSINSIIPDISILIGIKDLFLWLIAGGIIVLSFTVLFKYIPSVKVHFSAAFNSAVITGIAFTILQYLYFETQLMVTRMNTVYGVMATIPLFLIWVNTSWWIILIGAEISHAFQDIDNTRYDGNLINLL